MECAGSLPSDGVAGFTGGPLQSRETQLSLFPAGKNEEYRVPRCTKGSGLSWAIRTFDPQATRERAADGFTVEKGNSGD